MSIKFEKVETEGSEQWAILRKNKEHQISLTRKEAIDLVKVLDLQLWGEKDE